MSEPIEDLYRPPAEPAERAMRPVRLRGYGSAKTRAYVAGALMGISAFAAAAGVILAKLEAWDLAATATEIVEPLVTVVAGLAFFTWVHRIHSNIPALGKDTEITPSSAIIHYFIPFLNLVRPYQHMMAAWRLSAPKRSLRDAPSPIALWWGVWITRGVVAWFVGFAMGRAAARGDIPEDFAAQQAMMALTSAAAAALCIRMMIQLSERQDRAARRRKRRMRKRSKRESAALEQLFADDVASE